MTQPLRISFLMETSAIGDLLRTVLSFADALIARGHQARVVSPGPLPSWATSRAEWIEVDLLQQYSAQNDDSVVATTWPTLSIAVEIGGPRAVHLFRQDESILAELQPIRGEIEAAYRLPAPKLVLAKSLISVGRQFTNDVTYIGQIVDQDFYRTRTPPENDLMRVLLCGPSQADVKGIAEGYGAAAHARWFHQKFDLIRVSSWAPSRGEPLDDVQEFHVALDTREMTRLMHSCDVLIAPNHREEGFGLPAAEAMASGIPTVVTSIPSFLSFDEQHDYALFAPEENAVELGERLIEMLSDAELRERIRRRGREVAEQWRAERVAARLEEFFLSRRTRL